MGSGGKPNRSRLKFYRRIGWLKRGDPGVWLARCPGNVFAGSGSLWGSRLTPHASGGAYNIKCQLLRLIFSKCLSSVSLLSRHRGAGLTSVFPSRSVRVAHLVRPIPRPSALLNRLFSGFLIPVTSFVSPPSILLASLSFSVLGRPDPTASPAVSRPRGFPRLPCGPRCRLGPSAVLVLACSSAPVPWGGGPGFRADGHQEDPDHWIPPRKVPGQGPPGMRRPCEGRSPQHGGHSAWHGWRLTSVPFSLRLQLPDGLHSLLPTCGSSTDMSCGFTCLHRSYRPAPGCWQCRDRPRCQAAAGPWLGSSVGARGVQARSQLPVRVDVRSHVPASGAGSARARGGLVSDGAGSAARRPGPGGYVASVSRRFGVCPLAAMSWV